MKTYRKNALLAGVLYILGTVFGILSGIVGGDVISSVITGQLLTGVDVLSLVAENPSGLTLAAFFTLLMGISLSAMTVFLYPILKKDSEELASGMVLFRGALEGSWYVFVTLGILTMVALGNEYVAAGANSAVLQSMGNVLYQYQDFIGPVGSLLFIIGALCLYVSFYRTRLIPRWLAVWGFISAAGYIAYILLHFFHLDDSIGFWLQMIMGPQELVMGAWLLIKGFNQDAVRKLDEAQVSSPSSMKSEQTVALQA